jgi:hypothetical protein
MNDAQKITARPGSTAAGRDLHDQVALLVAGHTVEAVLEALTRSLSNAIGFAAETREQAAAMCSVFAQDADRLISANWAELREARGGNVDREQAHA